MMASDNYEGVSREYLVQRMQSADRRTCWVCFATEEDEPLSRWVRPCRCKGTARWVHNYCLQRWFDEKQNGNPNVQVYCPQCNTEYTIRYPPAGILLLLLEAGEKVIDKICPIMSAGFIIGSLYWTAVTFGAMTVMQVMGHKVGLEMREWADPLFLIVGLPTIPLALCLSKMICWEDYVLHVWRKQSRKWWILRKVFGTGNSESYPIRVPVDANNQLDITSSTRVLCSALMLPTFATVCGNYFFSKVNSPLKKTLLGGAVFIAIKGVIHMYYKQQQYMRLARRQVEDFNEPAPDETTQSTTSL